jgi:hypothetical protein
MYNDGYERLHLSKQVDVVWNARLSTLKGGDGNPYMGVRQLPEFFLPIKGQSAVVAPLANTHAGGNSAQRLLCSTQ